jgi:hypothetical protein
MANCQIRRELKVNYSTNNPQELSNALMELPSVKFVSFEYPAFWGIELTNGIFVYLGKDLGETETQEGTSWNDHSGELCGAIDTQDIALVVKAFASWVQEL